MITSDEGERILEHTEQVLLECIEDIYTRAKQHAAPFERRLTELRAHRRTYLKIIVTGEVSLLAKQE